ncbi:hypothetical protein GGP91_003305 [Salinibacter ruber]|uniref:hypothetical protein n=1 Tax=Salinibacter ruber TaxID=146919 RepID=UPI0021678682|nr:hypothetical protein [Salinibacter ruber]MCS3831206.1 hypothetical protein [Salinibacter ruber]
MDTFVLALLPGGDYRILTPLVDLFFWTALLGRHVQGLKHQLKAWQAEKKSTAVSSNEQNVGQSFDMSAPVSRKEAKKRRKAALSERTVGPSACGKGPSSMAIMTANLPLRKLDIQLGSVTGDVCVR